MFVYAHVTVCVRCMRRCVQVFERARSCKPCVLFFDEIDSLAPARGQVAMAVAILQQH